MKIVLKNKKSGAFFAKGTGWVTKISQATVFGNTVEAEKCCKQEKLVDAHILLKADGNGTDIALPCC